jgi:hypothetical protein
VENELRVDGVERASAEREVIDRIQEIGLSLTVMAYQTIHFGRQAERCRLYVFKMNDRQFPKNHDASRVEFLRKVKCFKIEKRKKSSINFSIWDKNCNFARKNFLPPLF